MSTGHLEVSAIDTKHWPAARPATDLIAAMPHPLSRDANIHDKMGSAPRGGLSAWQIKHVLARIDANIDGPLRLAELAAAARLSSSYFSRPFKVSVGETPHAYIMRHRMEHAKRLMLEHAAPLAEIALSCGLADQAHLSRMFRQIVGESPNFWGRRRFRPGPDAGGCHDRIVHFCHTPRA